MAAWRPPALGRVAPAAPRISDRCELNLGLTSVPLELAGSHPAGTGEPGAGRGPHSELPNVAFALDSDPFELHGEAVADIQAAGSQTVLRTLASGSLFVLPDVSRHAVWEQCPLVTIHDLPYLELRGSRGGLLWLLRPPPVAKLSCLGAPRRWGNLFSRLPGAKLRLPSSSRRHFAVLPEGTAAQEAILQSFLHVLGVKTPHEAA